ncbi:hypothetical protein PGB90_004296 [Kerria lacca]
MAGQKFQYDESGGTFYYFILSFLALLLVPGTYYWWPREVKKDAESSVLLCQCTGCKKKKIIMQKSEPWKIFKHAFMKLLIVGGWLILAFLTYKVSQFDYEYSNFDPYEILGIPLGSSEATIKKAYRRLSLILHPDKETGNEKAFMKLTKAYQALTDDESRKNWEKYGNPDGPGAMSFGIALPSWIVEKENSVLVLGLYALVFMVALPTAVGMWWYKSIRYSGDKVLLDTTRMYYFFFHKTPSMPLKRVIMILGASLEFEKKFNSEIIERETDEYEIPKLIAQLHNLGEKNRERPLYYKYSLKARALIHAHLWRIPLNPETLDIDRIIVIQKCPHLIQEMINCIAQLILLAYAQRVPRLLNIETLENCMKLCPMVVQALWECKSPLLQLPYVQEEHLKHFVIRRRYIRNVQQFAQLKLEDKKTILKFLKDDQFDDVMRVISKMPHIDFQVRCEVIDDEASTVFTAGAIVTVTVLLKRRNLSEVFGDETYKDKNIIENDKEQSENKEQKEKEKNEVEKEKEKDKEKVEENGQSQQNKSNSRPVWQKKQHKTKKSSGKKQTHKKQQISNAEKKKLNWERKQREKEEREKENAKQEKEEKNKEENNKKNSDDNENSNSDSDSSSSDDEESGKSDNENEDLKKTNSKRIQENSNVDDDDDDWEKFQTGINKRDRVLEGRSKESHTVHCPYFPEDKQEYWWVYVSDRKSRTLLTAPYHVTELVDYDEIQLKFTAPRWPGIYTFAVCLRSDSYLGFDQMHDIKLDVKEAPKVPTEHPQWDITDDEDESKAEDNDEDISEFTTDEDVEE